MEEAVSQKKSIKGLFAKIIFNTDKDADSGTVLNNVIRKLIYLLVVLIPIWFLPLTTNVLELNKQVLLVFLTVITLILWLIRTMNKGQIEWRGNILNILISAFAVIYIVATMFSFRPYTSLVGFGGEVSSSLIVVLSLIALYFLIITNFKGSKDVLGLLFAFIVSSAAVTIFALLQMWGGFILPWSFTKIVSFNTIGTTNALGLFSATILTLLIALLFVIKRNDIRVFFGVLGVLNLFIILSLNYWVLWLVLAVGMMIVVVFSLMYSAVAKQNAGRIIAPIFLLAVSLIFLLFRPSLPIGPNLPIEVGLSQKGGFTVVKNIVMNNPVLGTGPETFSLNYIKYKPVEVNQTVFWNVKFSKPPSEIYSITSDAGILGALAFLAILVWFIFSAVKNLMNIQEDNPLKKFLSIGLFASWLGLTVGLFLYPQNLILIFTFWLLFSLYLAQNNLFKDKIYNIKKTPKILLLTTFSLVVGIILIIGFLYLAGTRFVAEAKYKQGIDLIQVDDNLDGGITKLLSASTINPYEDKTYRVLAQYFLAKINVDINSKDVDTQQRANLVQVDAVNAINAAAQSTKLFPENVVNWIARGQIYRGLMGLVSGADGWAETAFQKAIELDPSDPFLLTEWGKVYINDADLIADKAKTDSATKVKWNDYLKKAMDKFSQAVEIKPDYATAHFEMATVYDRQGKLIEAITKMEINRKLLPNDAGIAFQLGVLYYRAEKYDQAKAEFIRAIAINNDYSNARYFLGLLYDKAGDKQSALDQFERIAQLNPDNEQIKQIISNLKLGLPALGSSKLGPPNQPAQIPIETNPGTQN